MGQDVEHHQAIFHPAPRRNLLPQNSLLAFVVRAGIEGKRSGSLACRITRQSVRCGGPTSRLNDGPTGEAAGYFLNILLGVATIDSQRVQLHQLARVVLVDTATRLLCWRWNWSHWCWPGLLTQDVASLFPH